MARRPTIRAKPKAHRLDGGDGAGDDDDDIEDHLAALVDCTQSYLAGAADADLGAAGGLTLSRAELEPGRSFAAVGSMVDRLVDAHAIALGRQTLRVERWVVDRARAASGGSSSSAGPRMRGAAAAAAAGGATGGAAAGGGAALQPRVLGPAAPQSVARLRRWAASCWHGALIALRTVRDLAVAVIKLANDFSVTVFLVASAVTACYRASGWLSHVSGMLVGAAPPVPPTPMPTTLPRVRFAALPIEQLPAALPQEPPTPLVPMPSPAPTAAAEATASPVAATDPGSAIVPSSTEPAHSGVAPRVASSTSGVSSDGRADSTDVSSVEKPRHPACPPGEVTIDEARASIKAYLSSHYWLRPTRSLRQCEGCDRDEGCVNETTVRVCMGV